MRQKAFLYRTQQHWRRVADFANMAHSSNRPHVNAQALAAAVITQCKDDAHRTLQEHDMLIDQILQICTYTILKRDTW